MKTLVLSLGKFLGALILVAFVFVLAICYEFIPYITPKNPNLYVEPKISKTLPNVNGNSNNMSNSLKNLYTSLICQTESGFSFNSNENNKFNQTKQTVKVIKPVDKSTEIKTKNIHSSTDTNNYISHNYKNNKIQESTSINNDYSKPVSNIQENNTLTNQEVTTTVQPSNQNSVNTMTQTTYSSSKTQNNQEQITQSNDGITTTVVPSK